jgi:hypothetical protein
MDQFFRFTTMTRLQMQTISWSCETMEHKIFMLSLKKKKQLVRMVHIYGFTLSLDATIVYLYKSLNAKPKWNTWKAAI